jgi:hypothetical protein
VILLSQWYEPANARRRDELASARGRNESSGVFEKCAYVDGTSQNWTYGDFFSLAASRFSGRVCVIANTDIVFDDTASLLPDLCHRGRLIALTRWESYSSPRMLGHFAGERFFSGSQDAWAFVGGELTSLGKDVPLGRIGCDNCIAGEACLAGFEVVNPSLDIVSLHIHASGDRGEQSPVYGRYGYPELCSSFPSGLVLCHDWRPGSSMSLVQASLVETCQP